ncbi:MAG: xylanase [Spirochaetales bacterium]|nr:xylanase [Spirochaetales bacterium]
MIKEGAFYSQNYVNLFALAGIPEEEVTRRIDETFDTLFFDPQEKIYFEMGPDMGYMLDTGNDDARSEGMSYGMMMAVQRDRKDIFDRLWLFSKSFMYQNSGKYEGYFAWSVSPEGKKNAQGPAPDGEEYFAMALYFASRRWGDGEAPFDYGVQARDILRHCVHQDELVKGGDPMWDRKNYLIKFVPELPFSDPSYHLPHFYELFALFADEDDRAFWSRAAGRSRKYLQLSCHGKTGMAAEYAEYDGSPVMREHHGYFYSDAYRVAMNIGLDAAWFGRNGDLALIAENLLDFFFFRDPPAAPACYRIDGTPVPEPAILHPLALVATNAAGALALSDPRRLEAVRDFWARPLRRGNRRYYDNCLSFFCLLMLAGEYRIFL